MAIAQKAINANDTNEGAAAIGHISVAGSFTSGKHLYRRKGVNTSVNKVTDLDASIVNNMGEDIDYDTNGAHSGY